MKTAKLIRQIDDLGQIVIPKELRLHFNLKDGDALELFVNNDMICLKKSQSYDNKKACQVTAAIISFEEVHTR